MRFLIALCALLFLTEPTAAQELKELRKSIIMEALSTYEPTREQRIKFALWIGKECNSFLEKTPSLSPREEDWLKKERAGGRLMELHQTPEFSRDFVRSNAKNCRASAQWIRKSKSKDQEMGYWATLVSALIEDDWKWHVDNARTKGGVTGLTEDDARTAFLFELYGERFFNYIIVPYLLRSREGRE